MRSLFPSTKGFPFSTDRDGWSWPVLLLLLAVLEPSGGVLWMMRQAMENERLAVRQRMTDLYQVQLESARQRQFDVPIIMLTAKGQESEIVEGLEWGADDYVTKPFSIHELLARVKAFLRRSRPTANGVYQIGDAAFDVAGHKLMRAGVEVLLTTKEYRMLAYFLSRPNRALTRGEIMNHVWGRSIIVSGRSVDRCIATLRNKIEPDLRQPTFIHTVRDVGYRFELLE